MKLRMRHTGSGMLALFDGDTKVREIGVTPGWNFKDRDEVISRFNEWAEAKAEATPTIRTNALQLDRVVR